MGLFDTVHISSDVAAFARLTCRSCGRPQDAAVVWQTKSLDAAMISYFLRHDENGAIRLYLLDRPSDRRFWRPWTEEEIEESERMAAEGSGLFMLCKKTAGEGHFLPDAYRPEHRRHRFMGELPHQWVEIDATCECGEFVDYWIKFCDGIATEFRSQAPTFEPGFFDQASEFGL